MKTKELLKIVVDAENYREDSYDGNKYGLTLEEAIDKAIASHNAFANHVDSGFATPAEKELALFLIRNAWNDVQEWAME